MPGAGVTDEGCRRVSACQAPVARHGGHANLEGRPGGPVRCTSAVSRLPSPDLGSSQLHDQAALEALRPPAARLGLRDRLRLLPLFLAAPAEPEFGALSLGLPGPPGSGLPR